MLSQLGRISSHFVRIFPFRLVLMAAVLLLIIQNSPPLRMTSAAGIVGNGSAASCTEAALDGALSGGGSVTFNCGAAPVIITITAEKLTALDTVIDGGGSVTLKGGGNTRIFHIGYQKSLSIKNITLSDTTLTSATENGGAAISGEWQSNLSVTNAKFINNTFSNTGGSTYDKGGAIFIPGGVVVVNGTDFTNNTSYGSGGAAIHTVGSNLTVTNSTFNGNRSTDNGNGGAIYSDNVQGNNGFVVIQGSTFNSNTSQSEGGAIRTNLYNGNQSGTYDRNIFVNNSVTFDAGGRAIGGAVRIGDGRFSFTNSTFSGNSAQGQGGAIWTGETVQLTIANSAIVNNRATNPAGNMGFGGGLAVNSSDSSTISVINTTFSNNSTGFMGGAMSLNTNGPVNITNATIADNYAWWQGGGLQNAHENVTLRNTLITNNTANNGGNNWNIYHNCFPNGGSYSNGGNNLQYSPLSATSNECGTTIPSNLNPQLGPLANNGGLSQTRALPMGSPAVDQGNNATCPSTDQRGVARPGTGLGLAAVCDIGAFELTSQAPPVTPPPLPTAVPPLPTTVLPSQPAQPTPNPGTPGVGQSAAPSADLIAQLRVVPDRRAANNPENLITYTLKVKNIGEGGATNLVLSFPVDPNLVVGYTQFTNPRVWVSAVTTTSMTIGLPSLENHEIVSGTIVLRPNPKVAPPVGTKVISRFKLGYNDPTSTGKQQVSNAVAFTFGEVGSDWNVSDGRVQLFDPSQMSVRVGSKLEYKSDFFLPGEFVSSWLTGPDNKSSDLGGLRAGADGLLKLNVATAQLSPGTYTVAAYGNRSEITLSSVLIILAPDDSTKPAINSSGRLSLPVPSPAPARTPDTTNNSKVKSSPSSLATPKATPTHK